ncbi:MAG: magnesium transporter CorA family protein [Patescibacteria group bacterium]|nr:magnesium transporter CorA family protein [Patescibacteria group bacterium]
MSLAELKKNNLRWVNISEATKGEIDFLRNNFNFHPLDLEDCLVSGQRPKIEKYEDYIFLVLIFPVYNRETREIEPSEINFFIGHNLIITIHDTKLPPVNELYEKCQTDDEDSQRLLSHGSSYLLYEMLDKLLSYCYPMLDHISIDIRTIEKQIFAGYERKNLSELLITRRNITDFRKIMQAHKNTLKKLAAVIKDRNFSTSSKIKIYYNDLIELSKEIWDHLGGFKEAIETLQDTNESLISNRLNDIMKTFTTMSVVIFVMTLVATLFGIGAPGTPFLNLPWAFWLILMLLIVVAMGMWQYFKKRKYL